MADTDYADNLVLLANTLARAQFLLHILEQTVEAIDLYVNAY